MSQFSPPPPPGGMDPAYMGYSAPKPYSKAAVTGFVFSLLMCLPGLHAVLGLIFGLVGLGKTSGGEMRGRGLAIAAIPISILAGLVSTGGAFMMAMFGVAGAQMVMETPQALKAVFLAPSADLGKATAALRPLCSDAFNAKHDDEAIRSWVTGVGKEYGAMVKVAGPPVNQPPQPGSDIVGFTFPVEFVNKTGQVNVKFRMSMDGLSVKFKVEGIDVGGLAPGSVPASAGD